MARPRAEHGQTIPASAAVRPSGRRTPTKSLVEGPGRAAKADRPAVPTVRGDQRLETGETSHQGT